MKRRREAPDASSRSANREDPLRPSGPGSESRLPAASRAPDQYTISILDTHTGVAKMYVNPQGTLASAAETAAF